MEWNKERDTFELSRDELSDLVDFMDMVKKFYPKVWEDIADKYKETFEKANKLLCEWGKEWKK